MAVMKLNSRMIYWRIYHGDEMNDITRMIGPYISSIKIRRTSLPLPKNTKKKSSPTNLTFTVTSPNYVEEIFVPGFPVKIMMGYDPLSLVTVFSGRIKFLPEGSARDMLNYTVEAFGTEIDLADEERNRTFFLPYKSSVIWQVAIEAGYVPNISIADVAPLQGQFIPIQKQETDLQFLMRCAKDWNCRCWFTAPNILNFADADVAYSLGDVASGGTYLLGYRTDKVPCNVETVKWKHKPPVVSSPGNSGLFGFNEFGKKDGSDEYRISNYDNKTWILKPEYIPLFKRARGGIHGGSSVEDIKKISLIARHLQSGFGIVSHENYVLFKKYFVVEKYNDNSRTNEFPPSGTGSGFEISVHLNEGDPTIVPPRNALLYSGTINPKADSASLPRWINASGRGEYAKLKVNETILDLSNGMLKSELVCTMGKYGE